MSTNAFGILTIRPGASPWGATWSYYQCPTRSCSRGRPSPSWTPLPPDPRRLPFSSFSPWGENCFPPPPRRSGWGGVGFGVFGRCVRRAFTTEATPGLLGLLLGLLFRRLVGHRNQHLRQKWDSWVFGQRSRTLDPLRLLCPALKRQAEKLRVLP